MSRTLASFEVEEAYASAGGGSSVGGVDYAAFFYTTLEYMLRASISNIPNIPNTHNHPKNPLEEL